MLSRLVFCFKDEPITVKKLYLATAFQIIALCLFQPNALLLVLFIITIILNLFVYYFERKIKNINLVRLLSFITYFLSYGLFTSSSFGMEFNNGLLINLLSLKNYFFFLTNIGQINWLALSIIITAVLFLINEANILIRYFFELFSLTPINKLSGDVAEIDSKEYTAGRIIGMLERTLIFFFLLADQYAAIGFIIAAKGFTRFKELDDRNFAEYVLVGTFFSALTAILVTLLIKTILPK